MLLAVQPSDVANGDTFFLVGGGEIRGELKSQETVDGELIYYIETDRGGQLAIERTMVRNVKKPTSVEREYAAKAKDIADTLEAQWEMAEWCRLNRLNEKAKLHLSNVLKFDSDHEDARHRLGYSRIGGKWVLQEQHMMSQGYVKRQGRWRTAEELALADAKEEWELLQSQWRRDIKRWRTWIGKRRSAEAVENFKAIDDPAAIAAIDEMIRKEENNEAKLMLLKSLANIADQNIAATLTYIALADSDDHLRETAILELVKLQNAHVVRNFMGYLDPAKNSPTTINRSARALTVLEAKIAVRSLIEALVTEHQSANPNAGGPGSISTGFGDQGLDSFSFGGDKKPKVFIRQSKNSGVLAALRSLTDQDFQFNKQAWLRWYTEIETPRALNLRRVE